MPAWKTYSNGTRITVEKWYHHGVLHRDNDLPAHVRKEFSDVILQQYYYKNGKLHRDNDKPALIEDGFQQWYYQGKIHRLEKPAVMERKYGVFDSYYYHGFNLNDIMEINNPNDYWKAVKLIGFL